MKRFLNDPDFIVDDMLLGFVAAHPTVTTSDHNAKVVHRRQSHAGKVGVVTGGGSGHEPAFLGYLGQGLLDAVAVGEVFASPTAQTFLDAFTQADTGAGVACLFGNYAGDNMNVKMAVELAEDEGIEVQCVVANDDIASAPREESDRRHGIAGGFVMWKVGGATAARGGDLAQVLESARKAVAATRSICVGLEPLTIPAVGKPGFTIAENLLEFGIGHHGEPGIRSSPMTNAAQIATEMAQALLDDFDFDGPRRLSVILSGLGSTPLMELYVLYGTVAQHLTVAGHTVERVWIGDFVTSLNMNGVALTMVELDDELAELMSEPGRPVGLPSYEMET